MSEENDGADEVELPLSGASQPAGLPWVQLTDDWPHESVLPLRQRRQELPPSLWSRLQRQLHDAQRTILWVLHLLTCNFLSFFFEHATLRNVVYLVMTGGIFLTTWVQLPLHSAIFALGLLYVITAARRVVSKSSLWNVVVVLACQAAFDLAPEDLQKVLWYSLCAVAISSEVFWWSAANAILEEDFHTWLVHFSTVYVVIVDFWFWPQLLTVDPSKWHIVDVIATSPAETQEAFTSMAAGAIILIAVPLFACFAVMAVFMWRRSPTLFLTICIAYFFLALVLIFFQDSSPAEIATIGQLPIGAILILMGREQLQYFEDFGTWRRQGLLVVVLFLLRMLVIRLAPSDEVAAVGQAAAMLLLLLASKLWLSSQHEALRSRDTTPAAQPLTASGRNLR